MNIGTRSVLFGAHCFFIHPFFVALAWWKLYGFPFDPRLWVAFFVHDIGYLGKPNMDGPEGESHVHLGAKIMSLFDKKHDRLGLILTSQLIPYRDWKGENETWHNFTFYHSRFMAKRYGHQFSKLCVADKLAVSLEPVWLYLPRVIATGEVNEYMDLHQDPKSKYGGECEGKPATSRIDWCKRMQSFCRNWAYENRFAGDEVSA